MSAALWTAAGKGLGGISDTIGQYDKQDAERALAKGDLSGFRAAKPMIDDAWDTQKGYWGSFADSAPGAFDAYGAAANDSYWTTDPEKFAFDKSMQDYIDPALQYNIQQGIRGLDASAASKGGLFSSGHGKSVTGYAQDESAKENIRAQDRYRSDRDQAYKEYSDYLTQQQSRRTGQLNALQGVASLGMQGLGNLSTQRSNYDTSRIQNTVDINQAKGRLESANQMGENMFMRTGLSALGGGAEAVGSAGGYNKFVGG